ncbi:hypothetical protein SEPCBS119000_002254 [Sporothrix epigloea]|uniref:Condensin complex subunit 2 n=1 Tax=Sporothrix epigloea TaxID=1892477 RepID=A0ABP0DHX1_9PEZI
MPRVTQAPLAKTTKSSSRRVSGAHAQSPFKVSPVNIPLNDDAQEKAARMQSRQALHEAQINQLKAATTPTSRKIASMRLDELENASPSSSGSPRTPLGARGPRGRGKRQSMGPGAISSKEAIVAAAAASGNRAILGGRGAANGDDNDDDGVVVGGAVVTPIKRVPILANFEEWMKMATDNKINATNSWNFALIDYFHDMSLLKEGDGVNFQKASCTLDGCVKIYTSRVDSVATETGKLLSGLADSRENKKKGGGGGGDGDNSEDEDELDEDGNQKKKPKKKQRSEVTLAPSFASLQLKKLELELAVDPLFKKASADFDEGGAKGLLLNHLMIDTEGRIVFDSSDDANDVAKSSKKSSKTSRAKQNEGEDVDEDMDDGEGEDEEDGEPSFVEEDEDDQDVPIDVASLGHRFFPELHRLEELDICPSLKTFDLGDPSGSLDIPFLRTQHDGQEDADGEKSTMFIDEDNPLGFDDTDALGGFDLGGDINFGEGGEAWAREARLEPQLRVYDAGDGLGDDLLLGGQGGGGNEADDFTIAMPHSSQQSDKMHDNILGYFDQALRKNWASAEHWRIRKIKDVNKPATVAKTRKEKEPFAIDFDVPLDKSMAELLYTQASSNTAITLPKKDWKAKSRNLLPDDKHFHSKQLLSLFLKPKARLSRRRTQFGGFGSGGFMFGQNSLQADVPEGQMDEAFWASQKDPLRPSVEDGLGGGADGGASGNYDANFFSDDGLPFAGGDDDGDMDGEEFADAREHFSPADGLGLGSAGDGGMTQSFTQGLGFTQGFTTGFGGMTMTNAADLAFGTTLVTSSRRVRPEYVQYARVAKRVDVRRLKEELWKGMYFDKGVAASRLLTPPPAEPSGAAGIDERLAAAEAQAEAPDSENVTLKFTDVMNGLQRVYPKSMMDDISTSYCFISLLHLANEKGLLIQKTEELLDLDIRMDHTAEVTAEA